MTGLLGLLLVSNTGAKLTLMCSALSSRPMTSPQSRASSVLRVAPTAMLPGRAVPLPRR